MKQTVVLYDNSMNNTGLKLKMPTLVEKIRNEACKFNAHFDQRIQTEQQWAQQTKLMKQISANIQIENNGETTRSGELSPGCQACKSGKWDCIFLTLSCNLSCSFCLTPCTLTKASSISAFGNDIHTLIKEYAELKISGIGFSGGEPMLESKLLIDCLLSIHKANPEAYLWAYTNGLLLTKDIISALAEAGLDELRFNMAATGYFHPHILEMLRYAAMRLAAVTVEIPAIPEDKDQLLKALSVWGRTGVKYLNLHELIYEPGSPSEKMSGKKENCRMPDGHVCAFNPLSSDLVKYVFEQIETAKLPLSVNYCSLQSKAGQIRERRSIMATRTLMPYEIPAGNGEAESMCYFTDTRYEFAQPWTLPDSDRLFPGSGAARVRRLLPLTPYQEGQWIYFEMIKDPGGTLQCK